MSSLSDAHHGSGDIFMAQADESGGSFLAYSPGPPWSPTSNLTTRLADLVRPGDVMITMGAGDVTVLGPLLIGELERRCRRRQDSIARSAGQR